MCFLLNIYLIIGTIVSSQFSVVTTFNQSGYAAYGKRMIGTFLQNWPVNVNLYAYAEDCTVAESATNLHVLDLHCVSTELMIFKQKWSADPRATGKQVMGPADKKGKQPGIGFKWDAVRFAHKVYSIFHCAKNANTEWLIWMDADTVCHSPISTDRLERFCQGDLCFLGRKNKYTECGLYAMNLKSSACQQFLEKFQKYYDFAETGIFTLSEWHDSFVFDAVRTQIPMIELDWSKDLIHGEGHPLINSEWGAYLDHLKGKRKHAGRSPAKDLLVQRTEAYWQ
jgi:hypothetical protein